MSYTIIPATDFRPFDSATGYLTDFSTGNVSRTGGGGALFTHSIDIPPGAILQDITAYVTDTNATSNVELWFAVTIRDTNTGLSPVLGWFPPTISTDATPGATALVKTVNGRLPHLTNLSGGPELEDASYLVFIFLNTTDTTNAFSAVRLKWKRSVSPAPATARFDDVPTTHPFFQYIEALASAGITSGCAASPPQYCPDAPITRGQMAVFMSRALGLHWTP